MKKVLLLSIVTVSLIAAEGENVSFDDMVQRFQSFNFRKKDAEIMASITESLPEFSSEEEMKQFFFEQFEASQGGFTLEAQRRFAKRNSLYKQVSREVGLDKRKDAMRERLIQKQSKNLAAAAAVTESRKVSAGAQEKSVDQIIKELGLSEGRSRKWFGKDRSKK